MPRITARTEADPVSQAIAHSSLVAAGQPVPLVATSYDISIRGGLADVTAKRTFRNVETVTIEATITFPLPVHAVLYGLEARIGDRVLKAKARAKSDARADYEDAVDRGKTVVLHEELIKGIHLLSVGHIGPNSDIEVTARFALPLSQIGGRNVLRIPTTVGDVYGSSGFADCDELVHGAAMQTATLALSCADGDARLLGGLFVGGRASIALDRPIEIEVRNWTAREIVGRAADGKTITLSIEPVAEREGVIDAAILVDHSGSMGGICSVGGNESKYAAAIAGLEAVTESLREGDQLHVFQFDDSVQEVGKATPATWRKEVREIAGPRGGTEIGGAIAYAVATSAARDVLLITDGKSYAIDVQKFARSERRFTVVLIGEDSLDANVGHLAVLTGGDIFIPAGADVAGAVKSALASVRASAAGSVAACLRGGMAIEVTASDADAEVADDFSRAVAAYAASLSLSSLDEKAAAQLAEAEGLATHLTSLILVDEEGAAQQGLPATRKVALPTPAASPVRMYASNAPPSRACYSVSRSASGVRHASPPDAMCDLRSDIANSLHRAYDSVVDRQIEQKFTHGRSKILNVEKKGYRGGGSASRPSTTLASLARKILPVPPADLSAVAPQIDWALHGAQLSTGDLTCLDSRTGALVLKASECLAVRKAARRAKISQLLMVIGVLAWSVRDQDRHAARVARSLLGNLSGRLIALVAHRLHLAADEKAA